MRRPELPRFLEPESQLVTPFDRFFDDAAIFPPGNAPMSAAVPQHFAFRDGAMNAFVGPFVVTDVRLAEVATDRPIDISLICTGDVRAALDGLDDRFELCSLEIPVVTSGAYLAAAEAAAPARVPTFIEVGWDVEYDVVGAALAGTGASLKLRTGGTTAEAFPSPEALATAICGAVGNGIAFKCTAGLHQGVRATDEHGFAHHGFLNILLACLLAPSIDEVTSMLARTDAGIVREFAALSEDDVALARSRFVSFGTCSVGEPIDDLVAHGLMEEPA